MAFTRPHSTAADATFSAAGAAAWNADQPPAGADVGGIPYCPTATTETTSAYLKFSETAAPSSGVLLTVGTTGNVAKAGWQIGSGDSITTGFSMMWGPIAAPSSSNYSMAVDYLGNYYFNIASVSRSFLFGIGGGANTFKINPGNAAGSGISVIAGTATTDVQALSATQTWNAAGVTFTGWKFTITDTASAAGALAMQILGGASGTTSLFKVTKGGQVDAPSYAVGGAAGVSFGPSAVTSITVVNGIITAIS